MAEGAPGKEGETMSNPKATWLIQLNCTCPKCGEYVDLMDASDFWDGREHEIEIGEWGTEATNNFEVVCPDCDHIFNVELEF